MGRSPGFTAVAVLTLALGLGGATAVFSIVDGVLLRPLKFPEPERLYLARAVPPARSGLPGELPVNARHFGEWRTHCVSCEQVSLFDFQALTLVGSGEPVRLPGLRVSFNFFRTLGVRPALGRDFVPEEELAGHFGVVLITDALWRNRFGADRSIVGRAIQINGESHTVIGVLPEDLHLPRGDQWGVGGADAPLIFRPLGFDVSQQYPNGSLNYSSVVRLKSGSGPERAMAEMNALLADFMREYHLEGSITLIPLQRQMTKHSRSALWLLMGTVGAIA
jgi:putative ABC transport system permease protein